MNKIKIAACAMSFLPLVHRPFITGSKIVSTETWTTVCYYNGEIKPYQHCQADIYEDGAVKISIWLEHFTQSDEDVIYKSYYSVPYSMDTAAYQLKYEGQTVIDDVVYINGDTNFCWDDVDLSYYSTNYTVEGLYWTGYVENIEEKGFEATKKGDPYQDIHSFNLQYFYYEGALSNLTGHKSSFYFKPLNKENKTIYVFGHKVEVKDKTSKLDINEDGVVNLMDITYMIDKYNEMFLLKN